MTARSHPIVEKALRLQAQYPELSALQVLDQACSGHEGEDPDFGSCDPVSGRRPHPAYADDTDPISPFGMLLQRAFAPHLDPREFVLINLEELPDPALAQHRHHVIDEWQHVLERFAERYRLWTGGL
jgi:hypothetical protein